MDDLIEVIRKCRRTYSGTLYMLKKSEYSPADPSGNEGRFNGSGTNAYYFANTPEACAREVLFRNTQNPYCEGYSLYAAQVTGTFIDVGVLEGISYSQPKESGGWQPTQELSGILADESVLGFRWPSSRAISQNESGTCFCILQNQMKLELSDFRELGWNLESTNTDNPKSSNWVLKTEEL